MTGRARRAPPAGGEALEPTPLGPDGERVLGPALVASWREQGYAFVDGLFPAALVDALRRFADPCFPVAGSPEAAAITDYGSDIVFPQDEASFNEVTLHPRLIRAASELLGVPSSGLRLTQSEVWPKYGRDGPGAGVADNQDQRVHIDYPNHTLVHPPPWNRPEAVSVILYLDEHEDCGGGTAIVPRLGPDDFVYASPLVDSPGIGDLEWLNDREAAERRFAEQRPQAAGLRKQLYERERELRFARGSVLFYRQDTWHRGTPLRPGTRRLAQNLTYRRAECEWISTLHPGWAWSMLGAQKTTERLIATASLEQRAVLGFPQPGSPYWCEETLAAVEARYGAFGIDMAPYRAAL